MWTASVFFGHQTSRPVCISNATICLVTFSFYFFWEVNSKKNITSSLAFWKNTFLEWNIDIFFLICSKLDKLVTTAICLIFQLIFKKKIFGLENLRIYVPKKISSCLKVKESRYRAGFYYRSVWLNNCSEISYPIVRWWKVYFKSSMTGVVIIKFQSCSP